jgi:hypothetical protein
VGEIDEVFNEMELQVINLGSGISITILNIGMGLVILFSAYLWLKMNKFEVKNE